MLENECGNTTDDGSDGGQGSAHGSGTAGTRRGAGGTAGRNNGGSVRCGSASREGYGRGRARKWSEMDRGRLSGVDTARVDDLGIDRHGRGASAEGR